ncbi:MAG: hypothetical protein E7423_05050 [Ruminococcaceae bacterium]|jgi:hypothetical protein|nr:hypothetical protein [Oscillospiraceae bacterium]
MKKGRSVYFWLLMMLVLPGIGVGLMMGGVYLDQLIFSGGGEGHGIPIFTVIFIFIGGIFAVVGLLVAVINVLRRLFRR